MSPAFLLFLLTSITARKSHRHVNPFKYLRVYPRPVYLPIPPCYELDIDDHGRKFFGAMTTTKYETIVVKETMRPVCLLVNGNVPSCDHIHNFNRPNAPTAPNGRRPSLVDYESYFIEPSKPNAKIEITEVPFRGLFLLKGSTVELDGEHEFTTSDHEMTAQETPQLQDTRPVSEDVQERSAGGQRQLLQNVVGTAGTVGGLVGGVAGAVTNAGGLAGAVANAGGLAGAVANAGGLVVNAATNAGGLVAGAAGGGNRPQLTLYVTRVDKVVDGHITATLVPKNCLPSGGIVDALPPCVSNPYAAAQPYDVLQKQQRPVQQYEKQQRPPIVAVDIVSRVNNLVQDFVEARQAAGIHRNRYRTPFDGPFLVHSAGGDVF